MASERQVRLDGDPRSVRTARRVVTEVLVGAGRPEWVDDAVLATSEVVTNVVLHAGTAGELSVRAMPGAVRVEVRDYSLELPTTQRFGRMATTGRGMRMLALLSHAHGVIELPDGKVAAAPWRPVRVVLVSLVLAAVLLVVMTAVTAGTQQLTTRPGTVTRAGVPTCLALPGTGQVCLDAYHADHLRTRALRTGECVRVTYDGGRVVPGTLTRVLPAPCPPTAPAT
ncbi:ATP-binding protein [Angustibacter aerolatus]